MIELGTHIAKAVQGYLSESKNGREQVVIEFAPVKDPSSSTLWTGYFGDDPGRDGRTNTERTVGVLRMLGWEGDRLTDLKGIERNEVEIVVGDDEYNGKVTRKCQFVNPIGGGAAYVPKPTEGSKAEKFAESMKARINKISPAASPSPDKPVTDTGEIPF